MKRRYWITLILVAGLLALAGCNNPTAGTDGTGDGDTPGTDEETPGEDSPGEDTPGEYIPGSLEWTWVSGSKTRNQAGTYGSEGEPDAANVPGARDQAVSWTDESGNLWLFGGEGYDSAGAVGELNDLWRFDETGWTWVSGSNTGGEFGTYGSEGEADAANVPGARQGAVSWTDPGGDLWLFGGYGFDGDETSGRLNDLWRFDP